MNAGEKNKNTYNFSKVDKFLWNWIQLNKTFLIDVNKYFQTFKDALIIVQIQMENTSETFIIDDQALAKSCRSENIS